MVDETGLSCKNSRRIFFASLGAENNEIDELLDCCSSRFIIDEIPVLPLPDEPFVEAWREYASEVSGKEVFQVIRKKLVQLRFPVRVGTGSTEEYRAATLKGIFPDFGESAIKISDPDGLKLFFHQTLAGTMPVLQIRNRNDFVIFVQALTMRNEPEPVPESMGAVIVSGLNNWDRIHSYRKHWENRQAFSIIRESWSDEFARLLPRKELYQDSIIILSEGGYSGISAADAGMNEELWRKVSLDIRLEHECTHYFTRRVFGSMKNAVHDEFLADYAGIVAATGKYSPELFLLFMGLENFPLYREGGRFQNYLGNYRPSQRIFEILKQIVKSASENLGRFEAESFSPERQERMFMILALASLHLDDLASGNSGELIEAALQKVHSRCIKPL